MTSINEKDLEPQDVHVESVSKELTDIEKSTELVEDGEVTFKTKLAIFVRESHGQRLNNTNHPFQTLIIMYESYLFTQQMPAALLAYINADLGPDNRYPWIAISWNLGAAVIVTIGSRLSDIIGRRWFLIFGAASGAIGALVGATSQSITQSIVSGVIFGVGGGFQEMCFACAQGVYLQEFSRWASD